MTILAYGKLGYGELSGGLTLVTGTMTFAGVAATAQTLTLGLTTKLLNIQFSSQTSGGITGTGIPRCSGTLTNGTVSVKRTAAVVATYWFQAIGY